MAADNITLADNRKHRGEVRSYVHSVGLCKKTNAKAMHMTKRIATTVAALWLLGCIGNMALIAGGPMTTSEKFLASALWPVGLIVYLDRGAP